MRRTKGAGREGRETKEGKRTMIRTKDAIKAARAMLGAPYGSGAGEIDCINLIKHVIRTCPGGKPGYTTAGTNALWRSYDMSAKYRDVTAWRALSGSDGGRAGEVLAMVNGSACNHVGLACGDGTVIHASQSRGAVVCTRVAGGGWTHALTHRYIEVDGEEDAGAAAEPWAGENEGGRRPTNSEPFEKWPLCTRRARNEVSEANSDEGIENSPERTLDVPEARGGREKAVDGRERASEASSGEAFAKCPERTQRWAQPIDGRAIICAQGGLRQRETPGGRYMQTIPDGAAVEITQTVDGWGRTVWRGHAGWVSLAYLCRADGRD